MVKLNEENERIKRRFYNYMREAKGRDEKTIAKISAAISKFESSTKGKSFKAFHIDQAATFKRYLRSQKNSVTKKPLSHSTVDSTLRMVKEFFHWLAGQSGYKSCISYPDVEYFNNKLKDARIAHTNRPMQYPTMLQCARAFDGMAENTPEQMRNKAIFAFFMLAGSRIKATSTLRLKHINLVEGYVFQDARDVVTKGAKTIETHFYPVDQIYYDYFEKWVRYLYESALFAPEDPLFPKPLIKRVEGKGFQNVGLSREPYASTSGLYRVVKTAFSNVQLPAFTPHNFRRTHGALASQYCDTPEKIKAWSMNYGHEDVRTTINSYVPVSNERKGEIIKTMRQTRVSGAV